MGDWLARAWLQGAGDGNPEEEDRTARQQYVISVHDSWPRGRPALNTLMITVLDEVCDMVDHETGYGTFTVERIVERVSVGGPLTADQVRLAIQHLLEDGCVVSHGNDLYQVPAAPDWTQIWKRRRS